MRCRETLSGWPVEKVADINAAADLLSEIRRKIKLKEFRYSDYFPESPKVALFEADARVGAEDYLVSHRVDLFLGIKRTELAPSSMSKMVSAGNRFKQVFGDWRIDQITKSDLKGWRISLRDEGVKPETINDYMTIPRGVLGDAFDDELIDKNPADRITNFKADKESNKANPFTKEEIEKIAAAETRRVSERAMLMFTIWTGLSLSEVMALAWEDIDYFNGTIRIRRAVVNNGYKVPKELYRERTIELLPPALEWLDQQAARTVNDKPVTIDVLRRNNTDVIPETVTLVWRNSLSGEAFTRDNQITDRFLKTFLRDLGIAERGANQARHTFASQMLSHYVNKDWIINQLGHKDYTMLHKHYAKFIPSDIPMRGPEVMASLGREYDRPELMNLKGKPALQVVK